MIKNEFQYTNSQICIYPILADATKGRDRYMRKAECDKSRRRRAGHIPNLLRVKRKNCGRRNPAISRKTCDTSQMLLCTKTAWQLSVA